MVHNKKIMFFFGFGLRLLLLLSCLQACSSSNARYIDITVYGAKGDGISDDTIPIQTALNAIDPNGGVVFFPAGEYLISTGLAINNKANTKILGTGKSSNIPLCQDSCRLPSEILC